MVAPTALICDEGCRDPEEKPVNVALPDDQLFCGQWRRPCLPICWNRAEHHPGDDCFLPWTRANTSAYTFKLHKGIWPTRHPAHLSSARHGLGNAAGHSALQKEMGSLAPAKKAICWSSSRIHLTVIPQSLLSYFYMTFQGKQIERSWSIVKW